MEFGVVLTQKLNTEFRVVLTQNRFQSRPVKAIFLLLNKSCVQRNEYFLNSRQHEIRSGRLGLGLGGTGSNRIFVQL